MTDIDLDQLLVAHGYAPQRKVRHFVIVPGVGIGPIHLGMHRDDVAGAFTYNYSSFWKSSDPPVRSDMCEVVGLIMHYGADQCVDCIETTALAPTQRKLELFGHDVTQIRIDALLSLVQTASKLCERSDHGYRFPELGLHIFNTHRPSAKDVVESFALATPTAAQRLLG